MTHENPKTSEAKHAETTEKLHETDPLTASFSVYRWVRSSVASIKKQAPVKFTPLTVVQTVKLVGWCFKNHMFHVKVIEHHWGVVIIIIIIPGIKISD